MNNLDREVLATIGEQFAPAFRRLRNLLSPPDGLDHLLTVAANLCLAWPAIREVFSGGSTTPISDPLAGIPDVLEALQANAAAVERVIPQARLLGVDPLRGFYDDHPAWVTASYRPVQDAILFDVLFGGLLWAEHRIDAIDRDLPIHERGRRDSALASAWMALRGIARDLRSRPHEIRDAFSRIPDAPATAGRLYRDLVLQEQAAGARLHRRITDIRVAFDYAFGDAPPRRESERGRVSRAGLLKRPMTVEAIGPWKLVTDEPRPTPERARLLTTSILTKEQEEDLVETGCSPVEEEASVAAVEGDDTAPHPTQGRSARQDIFKIRGRAAGMAMGNQLLPVDWEVLGPHDIDALLSGIGSLGRGERAVRFEGVPTPIACSLALTVLWSGRGLSDVLRLTHDPTLPRQVAEKPGFFLTRHPDPTHSRLQYFWIADAGHVDQAPLPAEGQAQTVRLSRKVWLACPPPLPSLYDDLLSAIPTALHAGPVFPVANPNAEAAVRHLLDLINRRFGARLTLSRIESFMFRALAQTDGADEAAASLATGRPHTLSAATGHYTAIDLDRLARLHANACSRVLLSTGRCAIPDPTLPTEMLGSHAGSHYCPSRDDLRRALQNLATKTARTLEYEDSLSERHNWLTIYTQVLVGIGTGFRAVQDALFARGEVHASLQLAALRDKDSADYYNSRLVYLPSVCLEQLEGYWRHLDWLSVRLRAMDAKAYDRLWPSLLTAEANEDGWASFLLSTTGKAAETRPRTIRSYLQQCGWHFPVNAARHYLRSRLLARGCPAIIIDAFLGHWQYGREPFGPYAGLSPRRYRHVLAEHLDALLGDLGCRTVLPAV